MNTMGFHANPHEWEWTSGIQLHQNQSNYVSISSLVSLSLGPKALEEEYSACACTPQEQAPRAMTTSRWLFQRGSDLAVTIAESAYSRVSSLSVVPVRVT